MLRELKIENLALIESLQLTIEGEPAGLIVLTGETGAGKSIILQAIHLLAGGRGSVTWIRGGAESAVVEALFEISDSRRELLDDLRERGIELDGHLIIKRILGRNGRSRYYLNNTLATAGLVGEITENLLSIASQHDHQQLLVPRLHLDFIDSVGDHWEKRQEFSRIYSRWQELRQRHLELEERERERQQRKDLVEFQYKEIRDADIRTGEDEELAGEKQRLKASTTLLETGHHSLRLLSGTVIDQVTQIRKNLEKMAELDENAAPLADEFTENAYLLEDLADRLRDYLQSVPTEPARLEEIEERLDLLQRLKRKYGGINLDLEEVLTFYRQAELELAELENLDRRRLETAAELTELENKVFSRAEELTAERRRTAEQLTGTITRELKALNFGNAAFEVHFPESDRELTSLTSTGWDQPRFMFSANPGEAVKPLADIASGGELSRLLLGLKCLLAKRDRVETVIFDEVDAGIGGQAAEAVAGKIIELASHHQVFCITHLPQIASGADEHFLVSKHQAEARTQVTINRLSEQERIDELARMLAGDTITRQTLAFASELRTKHRSTRPQGKTG